MRISPHGDLFVVKVGEKDFGTPQLLEEAFQRIIEKMRQDTLVVDMRNVDTVTSLGVAVLIATQGLAMTHRRRVAFAGIQPAVRRTLELVGADSLLSLHATVEEAVESLSK